MSNPIPQAAIDAGFMAIPNVKIEGAEFSVHAHAGSPGSIFIDTYRAISTAVLEAALPHIWAQIDVDELARALHASQCAPNCPRDVGDTDKSYARAVKAWLTGKDAK